MKSIMIFHQWTETHYCIIAMILGDKWHPRQIHPAQNRANQRDYKKGDYARGLKSR